MRRTLSFVHCRLSATSPAIRPRRRSPLDSSRSASYESGRTRMHLRYRRKSTPMRLSLIEFPADDPDRAKRFWSGLLSTELEPRSDDEGEGWQTRNSGPVVGVHARGRGPGDSFSLPYFVVPDLEAAL